MEGLGLKEARKAAPQRLYILFSKQVLEEHRARVIDVSEIAQHSPDER